MMTKHLKLLSVLLVLFLLTLSSIACFNKRIEPAFGKALVEFKGFLNTSVVTNAGWVIASGRVVNNGEKRADWVQVTIYTKDKETGVILYKKNTYIKGSGPNGKSLEPGESARFDLRLDSKSDHKHAFEADVFWSEAL